MRGLVAVVLVIGCGRVGFDARAGSGGDAPTDVAIDAALTCSVGHDEDADGVDDCADRCPHVADPAQLDTDGDGVGDVCDPGTAMQRLVLFAPMTMGTMPFTVTGGGTWTPVVDGVRFDGTAGGQLLYLRPLRNVDIWVAATIESVVPRPLSQLAIALDPGDPAPYYYGELHAPGGAASVRVTHYDGAAYQVINQVAVGAVPLGDVMMRIGVRMEAAQMITVLQHATTQNVSGAIPGYVGSPVLQINVDGLALVIRSVTVIETLPP